MSYLVLARRFRPQTFRSIVGQEHITRAIANAILRDRVPHAFLLTGPRGVGKTTTARVLARALNCTGRDLPSTEELAEAAKAGTLTDPTSLVEPCGTCTNCVEIARSSNLAVREIDGASHNSVDNVRDLIESLRSLPPPGSRYKIYIIDEVHMLSTAAFNALLKSLEEPPPHTVFVFATTEPHKIPETVISRCQRHDFRRISAQVIAATLRDIAAEDNLQVEEDVFELVAVKAQGGMRDAQSMFDRLVAFSGGAITAQDAQKLFGVVDFNFLFELSGAVIARNPERCIEFLEEAFSQSLEVRSFIGDFVTHWRNLLLFGLSAAGGSTGGARGEMSESAAGRILEIPRRDRERLKTQAASVSMFDLQRLADIAFAAADQALSSNFPRYVLEAALIKMATLADLRPLPQILDILANRQGAPIAPGRRSAAPLSSSAEFPVRQAPAAVEEPVQERIIAPTIASVQTAEASAPKTKINGGGRSLSEADWRQFVHNLIAERRMPALAEYLRRVAVRTFGAGILVGEAPDLAARTLKEPANVQALSQALQSFFGVNEWDIRIERAADTGSARPAPGAKSAAPGNVMRPAPPARIRDGNSLPGSLAEQDAQEEIRQQERIKDEARRGPLVTAALDVFEGSKLVEVKPIRAMVRGGTKSSEGFLTDDGSSQDETGDQ